MKSKRFFIVTIFILVILILTISFSQELKLKQDDQKTTLEARVTELELKVLMLSDQVKSLEYKIDNPKTKIVPVN